MTQELFPIVDPDGHTIGSATRATCHDGKSHLLHPVVHLHIFTPDYSAIFLQRRSMSKDIQPGKWDTAVGGHVDYGETIPQALLREAREELAIDASQARHIGSYIWTSDRETELVNIHILTVDPATFAPTPDPVEVDEARFWTIPQIRQALGHNILTPNLEQELLTRILPKI